MPPQASFPLNAWYAAAYDVEVRHALLARTVCNQKLVLFRRTDGQVAALEDACWHRLMPLSMGRLEGDELVCGYHGLVYNSQGRCTHMPQPGDAQPLGLRAQPFRWWRSTASSGSGRAIRPRPTRRWCPTCTGTTTRPGPATAR